MERHFERELEELKLNLIQMGKVVDDQIDMAYRALFEGNEGLALQVIAKDQEVDAFDTLIDTQCQRIFALSQPVAADLRLLMAALNINTQIERIGDIAANVAERVPPLVAYKAFLQQTRISDMAEIARVTGAKPDETPEQP